MRHGVRNSALLRAKLELCSGALTAAYTRLWSSEKVSELVPAFLVLLHQIMRASVPLMESAARRCRDIGASDPLAASLASYFDHHIEEELNHDVWALEDLQAAGFSKEVALAQVPTASVAQLLGAQYYWILHHHPIMLLGHILVLEAFPPSPQRLAAVRAAAGVPEVALRTLRMHGELDPHHSEELDQFIDGLNLSEAHIEMIGVSVFNTALCLAMSVHGLRPIEWGIRAPV